MVTSANRSLHARLRAHPAGHVELLRCLDASQHCIVGRCPGFLLCLTRAEIPPTPLQTPSKDPPTTARDGEYGVKTGAYGSNTRETFDLFEGSSMHPIIDLATQRPETCSVDIAGVLWLDMMG